MPTMSSDAQISDANDGFLVGVDPKSPPITAAEWADVAAESEVSRSQKQPLQIVNEQPQEDPRERFFTAEDIERVRREEKDKLYGKISSMEEQMKQLSSEREARLAEEQAAREAAEAERKAKEEEEMELRQLLDRREQEFNSRLESLQSQYEQDRAVFEKERRLMELDQYRQAVIEQESEYIMPELRDLVTGNTEDEIMNSVDEMKQRTAIIMNNLSEAAQMQRQTQRGVSPTAPPVGPMENASEYQSLTPQDIATMDMETYRKYRDRLLPAASQAFRRGG